MGVLNVNEDKMSSVGKNLERLYKPIETESRPYEFFKGLAIYLEYIFSRVIPRSLFNDQMAERCKLYLEIEETEKKARKELNDVKSRLIGIIEKNNIDVKTFKRNSTWAFNDNTTILEEFESFEERRSFGSTFVSDEVELYLSDITNNLMELGL